MFIVNIQGIIVSAASYLRKKMRIPVEGEIKVVKIHTYYLGNSVSRWVNAGQEVISFASELDSSLMQEKRSSSLVLMFKEVRRGLRETVGPDIFEGGVDDSMKIILKMLEPNPSARLLDLGCGNGSNTLKFATKIGTKEVCGIEVVDESIRKAECRGVHVNKADLNSKWPVESQKFDVVVSNHSIEHVWNTRLYVSEIFRCLKPSGYAVVATENLASWTNILALLAGYQPFSTTNICGYSLGNPLRNAEEAYDRSFLEKYKDAWGGGATGHMRVLAHRALRDLFLIQGFRIESMKGAGYFPFKGKFSRLLSTLNPSHANFLIIKVRKLT